MFKNGLVPKSSYFGTMVQLVQESPTRFPFTKNGLSRMFFSFADP